MNISYYLLSKSFDEKFSLKDFMFQKQLTSFLEVLQKVTNNELVCYSLDLFDQVFHKGQSLVEWLYSDGEDLHDEKRLFQLKLRKMQDVDEADITTIIGNLQEKNYSQENALLAFFQYPISNVDHRIIVRSSSDCYIANRFYLQFFDDASSFLGNYESCFPQLYIHERVYQTLKRMKPFRDYIEELILHLTALNDHAQPLFSQYQDQSENVVLKYLGIKGDIYCSIQGDPAYERANMCFEFPSDEGGAISIICAPHTKLFNKYSNERIYFHWGHPLIGNGDKLLIGHIGDHL